MAGAAKQKLLEYSRKFIYLCVESRDRQGQRLAGQTGLTFENGKATANRRLELGADQATSKQIADN